MTTTSPVYTFSYSNRALAANKAIFWVCLLLAPVMLWALLSPAISAGVSFFGLAVMGMACLKALNNKDTPLLAIYDDHIEYALHLGGKVHQEPKSAITDVEHQDRMVSIWFDDGRAIDVDLKLVHADQRDDFVRAALDLAPMKMPA